MQSIRYKLFQNFVGVRKQKNWSIFEHSSLEPFWCIGIYFTSFQNVKGYSTGAKID